LNEKWEQSCKSFDIPYLNNILTVGLYKFIAYLQDQVNRKLDKTVALDYSLVELEQRCTTIKYTLEQQKLLIKFIINEYIRNIHDFGFHDIPNNFEDGISPNRKSRANDSIESMKLSVDSKDAPLKHAINVEFLDSPDKQG
jgi:hypothetical protein